MRSDFNQRRRGVTSPLAAPTRATQDRRGRPRCGFVLVACFALMLAWSLPTAAQTRPARPHFVVFLADDHGWWDSTPYGARDVRTPNMAALARAGMLFTHAFVASPSCAPSRAAMLTGLMPARNGAEANHTYKRDSVPSLPPRLKALGYQTAAFGKVAHGQDAVRHGFDVIELRFQIGLVRRFLEQRSQAQPLCLFVGTHQPHVPWAPHQDYDPAAVHLPPTLLDTLATREHRADYYTDVTQCDRELSEIRALARRYLGTNVVFIYSSDHGAQWPFGKWNLYDEGIRVPFLVEWPGVIPAGSRSDAMIQWIDLWPTLIELAGGRPPADIDGRSFAGVLLGRTHEHRDRIFTTHTGDGRMNIYPIRAVRTRRWKYILNLHPEFAFTSHSDLLRRPHAGAYWDSWDEAARHDPKAAALVRRYHQRPREELYDLQRDPFELRNLAGEPTQAEQLRQLRQELRAWMQGQGDRETVHAQPRLLSDPDSYKPIPPEQQQRAIRAARTR